MKFSFLSDDILAINKLYGMPMFKGESNPHDRHNIEAFLPFLAEHVGVPELYQVGWKLYLGQIYV